VSATSESLSLHINMLTKKTAAFPNDVRAILKKMKDSHARLPRPEAAGKRIMMPEKG
jgi:acyl-CoA thioester hydrolase